MPNCFGYLRFLLSSFYLKLNMVLTPIECIFVLYTMCRYPKQFDICEYKTGNMFYFEFNVTRFRLKWHIATMRPMFKFILLKTEHGVDTNRLHIRNVHDV